MLSFPMALRPTPRPPALAIARAQTPPLALYPSLSLGVLSPSAEAKEGIAEREVIRERT